MSSLLSNLKSSEWGKAGGGIATGQGRVYPLKNRLIFEGRSIKDFLAHWWCQLPKETGGSGSWDDLGCPQGEFR